MKRNKVLELITPMITTGLVTALGYTIGKLVERKRLEGIISDMYIAMGCSGRELVNFILKECHEAFFDWHSAKGSLAAKKYNYYAELYNKLISEKRLLGKLGLEKTSSKCELPYIPDNCKDMSFTNTEFVSLLDEETWKEEYFL